MNARMLYVALGLVILWFTWIAAVTISDSVSRTDDTEPAVADEN